MQCQPQQSKSIALGAALADARRARGLTQADLGSRVGVTQQSIAHYETGHMPPAPIFYLLATALGASPYALLRGVGTEIDATWRSHLTSLVTAQRFGTSRGSRDLPAVCDDDLRRAHDLRRMGQPRDAARLADEVVRRLERSQPDRKDTDLAATLWHAYDLHARVTTELYPPQVYTLVMGDCREMLALARGSLHHWPDAEARTLYRIAYISMLVGSGDHLRRAWEAVQRSETLARERITRLHALRVKAGILRRVGAEHTSQLQQIVRTVDREAGAADPLTAALVKQGIGLNLIVVSQRERPDSVRLIEEAEAAYEAAYRTGREDRHTWSLIQRTRAVLAALPGVDHDLETAQIYAEEGLDVARMAGWRRTAGQCSLVLKAVAQRKALDTVPV